MSPEAQVERVEGLVTIQDRGRIGWAHLGVPRGGALDGPAAALANRLVGNDAEQAVLELAMATLALRVSHAGTVAVAGAMGSLSVDGRAAAHGQPVSVRAGQQVVVEPPVRGVRCYLAVSGGIQVPQVLGSRCTDTLAWIGPPVVRAGTTLPLGAPQPPRPLDVPAPAPGSAIRLQAGPRADWFDDGAWQTLLTQRWVVDAQSNRVGMRLRGPALRRAEEYAAAELPSEGMVLGSVQVPPDGQPILFLHDHPVTGGYPVLAVAQAADLHVCAQLRPGEELQFRRG